VHRSTSLSRFRDGGGQVPQRSAMLPSGIPATVPADVRLPRVVARVALTAALALVVVPGAADSQSPGGIQPIDSNLFQEVQVASIVPGAAMAPPTLDPAYRSDGALDPAAILTEPVDVPEVSGRPDLDQPDAPRRTIIIPVWRWDPEVSFYGPGFYGKRTACGHAYTTTIMGVAHRTLPCGTMVRFRNARNGVTITVPVIDRGPYVAGRHWDLSGAACRALNHCYTGGLYWRFP
jgi:hypothetical protein